MLMIRLQRTGRKHEPTFRLVLTDSKNGPKSGKFLEILGSHDPRHKDLTSIKGDRIKEWMTKGVQLSGTVHNLLIEKKVIDGKKINVLPKKTPIVKEVVAEKAAPVAAPVAAPAPIEVAPAAPVEEVVAEIAPEVIAEAPVEVAPEEAPAVVEETAVVAEAPVAEEKPVA
jgi:small subunit ribosomal protein S16